MRYIHVNFEPEWVLLQRDREILPTDYLAEKLKETYQAKDIILTLITCDAKLYPKTGESAEETELHVASILAQGFQLKAKQGIYDIQLTEITDALETSVEDTLARAEDFPSHINSSIEPTPAAPRTETRTSLDQIRHLVGSEEFKSLAEECEAVAEQIKRYQTPDAFTNRTYLISINDGYGLTTYLNLFADLLHENKLFTFASKKRCIEVRPDAPTSDSKDNPFANVLSHFDGNEPGHIICIDIQEWMTKTADRTFRDFLHELERNIGKHIVFFRIPFVERNILRDLKESIGDLLLIRTISIVPFTSDELTAYGKQVLCEKGFTMEPEAWDVFQMLIMQEKNDGRFYGLRTVKKVLLKMIYQKYISNVNDTTAQAVIRKAEVEPLVKDDGFFKKSGTEMLEELVGMDALKQQVMEIVAQIAATAENESLGAPCIHMRFVGNPGTGKTTVARIIGKILKEKNILRNGNFFEYAGRDFCGRYIGETAPKTAAMCRDAYGSVLFIDEAYSLYRGDDNTRDYGREAIDTLVSEMENHRNDLVVIMAGYPDEMEKLMAGNKGLESRMPYQIEFSNYTPEQLAEIFLSLARKSFSLSADLEAAVHKYFNALPKETLEAKEFSNARFARNLFERTWGKAVLRAQMQQKKCTELTAEDFILATSEKEFDTLLRKKNKSIGF